ncbi:hypothetical protein MYX78_05745 [Acidobacteria bacterium AH-259-G07]|nr:hypothetical protein [Acidobacteria bacterium AH-259-G07]
MVGSLNTALNFFMPLPRQRCPRSHSSHARLMGGAYCVMASKHIRADMNYAYPTAEIAVMGPQGAVEILYRKELEASSDPQKFKEEKVEEFRRKFANPYIAAQRGYIDEVIEPQHTRSKLIRALEMTANKRDTNPPRKHGNIPL